MTTIETKTGKIIFGDKEHWPTLTVIHRDGSLAITSLTYRNLDEVIAACKSAKELMVKTETTK